MEISILDEDARDDVGKIIQATPTYSKSNRFKVIAQNLHPITHPYYTAYEPLRILCLGILQHKKLSYGNDSENNIAGILFDGASLWEEYLAKLFAEHKLDLIHSNNRTGENGIQLLVGGRKNHYPDFYRKKNGNKESIILDAKYKRLCEDPSSKENDEDNEFDGNSQSENGPVKHKFIGKDVMQMLAYMYALDSKNAVLLSPFAVRKDLDDKLVETITEPYWKDTFGKKGKISIIAFPIKANAMNYEELCKNMKTAETAFINRIKKLLGEPVEESKMFD
jgi:5-methylcytosine-specific restriction endonuclease McrBC regulatory subunit McrC